MYIDIRHFLDVCKYMKNHRFTYLKEKTPNLKKVCIFMHGTSGFYESSYKYMKYMNDLGYDVLAPDHVEYHRKHKTDIKYSTKPKTACTLYNQLRYKYAINFRLKELQTAVHHVAKYAKEIVLLGVSEGAISVSMFKSCVPVKKIMCSFFPMQSYFTKSHVFDKNNVTNHIYIIGSDDQYFSPYTDSISKITQKYCGGKHDYSPNVVVIPFANHDLLEIKLHTNIVKKIIRLSVQDKI